MEHSRFQHCLGVMHLSGRFARHWYANYLAVKSAKAGTRLRRYLPSVNFVEEVFRLAGLLHDIGHGPYSHTLDNAYKSFYAQHVNYRGFRCGSTRGVFDGALAA